jgi:hypothetical protein
VIARDELLTAQRGLATMHSDSIVSGRVCMFVWDEPIVLDLIVRMLGKLTEVSREARVPLVAIVVVPQATSVPGANVRNALRGVLPAVLDRCQELLIVIEGDGRERHLMRAMFSLTPSTRRGSRHPSTRFFAMLDDALAVAQRLAPHNTLAVQRALLRRKLRRPEDE